ncbi:DEAD/DEAH box helicase [Dyella sp.]|uniref:DEAD/DEAH box helicase n=1 Tax=Dyella sp. TaxID=1869338 RepID=UPI002D797C65|nr:DEAD/DEAH box helicase [Dyella sp.]HET7331505.1 DEAD/DEAH box helicase [Dyella sp.]
MESFETLSKINALVEAGHEERARDHLILLLDAMEKTGQAYSPLLNHLVRRVGLYPYLDSETADWCDRLALEAFKVEVGDGERKPLHREQSALLSKLLGGLSVAVSAPTSFGKSFVIDAFVALRKPKTVLLIVPTIALMDEARRRLCRKFGSTYKIVTTTDVEEFGEKTIFIFPQERAVTYANRIKSLDLFVVDEFYKASAAFDKIRSPSLIRAILRFSSISRQRYFLAPNISQLRENPFTRGMEFIRLDFNTVVLKKHDLSKEVGGDVKKKESALLGILDGKVKTLIYAGSHSQVSLVATLVEQHQRNVASLKLFEFSNWLEINYSKAWYLPKLIKKGVGVHNGQIHRSLSQIQIKLFDEADGLDAMISTSSIIEGVNTSAERVVVWSNKNGTSKLSDFDYKNILGRGGRMFRHFIGEVYILEKPPAEEESQLHLELPDSLLGMAELNTIKGDLSSEQLRKAAEFEAEISRVFDLPVVRELQSSGRLQSSDSSLIARIVTSVSRDPTSWRVLAYLNSTNSSKWSNALYKAIDLDRVGWDAPFNKVVRFVEVLSGAWAKTIPELLKGLDGIGIGIEEFFKLERIITFKLSSLLNDINAVHARIAPDRGFDIAPFIHRMTHAFLPAVVYQLEEYGLPRMISRRIHDGGILDMSNPELRLENAVEALVSEKGRIERLVGDGFDRYVLENFFSGVVTT